MHDSTRGGKTADDFLYVAMPSVWEWKKTKIAEAQQMSLNVERSGQSTLLTTFFIVQGDWENIENKIFPNFLLRFDNVVYAFI